jgi:hypothetical protein
LVNPEAGQVHVGQRLQVVEVSEDDFTAGFLAVAVESKAISAWTVFSSMAEKLEEISEGRVSKISRMSSSDKEVSIFLLTVIVGFDCTTECFSVSFLAEATAIASISCWAIDKIILLWKQSNCIIR